MIPEDQKIYQEILTAIVQKQMSILGPALALKKARNVKNLLVSEEGIVLSMTGNFEQVLKELINEFASLSGVIAKKFSQEAVEPILVRNPQLKTYFNF